MLLRHRNDAASRPVIAGTKTYNVVATITAGIGDQPWGVAASADGGR